MKRFGRAIVLFCLMLIPGRLAAGEWAADIVDMEWIPPRFVAVDKKAQSFALVSRQSPLRVLETIPCATGQELGDKFKEGDLKTPEGVYFITRRKTAGLNYELYGDLAFTLNFPNPMDVLRRKTGHGIWIHGRGHTIIPFETQGCVAMNTPDLHRVDTSLSEGMPVVIADEIRIGGEAARLRSEAREVVEATHAWAKAWEDRSDAFFGFHDAEKFALTEGQPFSVFRSHKERLFKTLPWIRVTLSDVRAIAGPDYWVTYFVQVYRSPSLVSQGVKRLYWQRGPDGRLRIVGMEYEENPVMLAAKGKAGAAPFEAEADTRKPDAPSEEEVLARQMVDAHRAVMEKVAQKAFHALTLDRQPSPEDQAILEVAQSGATKPGVSPFATDAAKAAPPPPEAAQPARPEQPKAQSAVAQAPEPAPAPPVVPVPVAKAPAAAPEPAPAAPAATVATASAPSVQVPAEPAAKVAAPAPVAPGRAAEIAAMVEAWRSAWEHGRLDDYMAFYADGAQQGNLKGKAAIRGQKAGLWRGREPGRVGMEVLSVSPDGDGFTVVCAMAYQGRGGRESKGYKTLALAPSGQKLLISRERWSRDLPAGAGGKNALAAAASGTSSAASAPAEAPAASAAKTEKTAAPATAQAVGPSAPPQKADKTAAVAAMVEAWRGAWERGRVDEYAGFYGERASQGDRHGREAIRSHKAGLWKGKAPRKVSLSDMKIAPSGDGFTVTCVQRYEGRDGDSDMGRKTLRLAPSGNGYAIVEETWSRL